MFSKTGRTAFAVFLTAAVLVLSRASFAWTAEELQAKIDERNYAIKALEGQIAEQQKQIDDVSKQANSLAKTIKLLDAERKKFLTQIKVAEAKIGAANFRIEELSADIANKERKIGRDLDAIASIIRSMADLESRTIVEAVLNHKNLSDLWGEIDTLNKLDGEINSRVSDLKELKAGSEKNKKESEEKKKELLVLKSELTDRKKIVEQNQAEKDKLLKDTKNKESNYKKILEEKYALRDAFERELLDFESQLRFEIDASRLPTTGTGVLKWPLDFVKITQYFGKTAFANANPQVYNGKGHNGIDLRAPVGVRVKSALGGKVVGAGNTDTVCPSASYGKWVMVEHGNGLSTLYGHLSLIKVGEGQQVETGDIIGYSGNTGYSTGPHLHFTVFASQGVRVMSHQSRVCRGAYTIPVADFRAYLNPLSYL